jgi:hypothetical protein
MGGTASAGSFFFVANSEADSISEFSMDPTSGALAQVGPPVTAGRGPAAIAATPDNQFIYVSNAGSNDVSAFAINPVSGALTAVSGSPFAAGRTRELSRGMRPVAAPLCCRARGAAGQGKGRLKSLSSSRMLALDSRLSAWEKYSANAARLVRGGLGAR